MSRAFIRESDLPVSDEPPRRQAALPPGTTNYVTAAGADRLRAEIAALRAARVPAPADGDPEARQAAQPAERRIAELEASLRTMQVVSAPPLDRETVRFGATVTVREAAGAELAFRIVGVDEADTDRSWISWLSPAARALLNARVGQKVSFARPGGRTEWEIRSVAYD